MTRQEFYQQIADATGEELATIESYGFEPLMPQDWPNRNQASTKASSLAAATS